MHSGHKPHNEYCKTLHFKQQASFAIFEAIRLIKNMLSKMKHIH